ncbi:dihydrofolate reductase [Salegentibacter sp. JZCK2]|uniref:NAD(P)-dependent oxidoreductase n=1 Tax=Salegentibacter tibetensis TaxID=2873600 RepID=UPI001CCA3CE7|nr:NAD(P)-dependent oxidoreductase [Salegentibacter tibetensis]MBZ9729173.1 dihydrofolate reductase [Salegentibacter tibetensis]
MKKFNKIVCVDHTKLEDWAINELQQYSESEVVVYKESPESEKELMERIGDAEAVIVSWKTQIPESVIKECFNLKYIGMACSLYDDESANVGVDYAREQGITVKGIFDYGDPGVIEFIVSELIQLLHGFGEYQWRERPVELTDKKIGIIGLGTTGQLLAEALLPMGADLYYFSRSRKNDWEAKGLQYLSLEELLKTTGIISLHLPKNTKLLGGEEFKTFGSGKILINTSLGLPFQEKAFVDWIKSDGNFAIFDGDGGASLSEGTKELNRVIFHTKSAGWSAETQRRLSEKVLENLKSYFK